MDQLTWLLERPPFTGLDQEGRTLIRAAVQITYLAAGDHLGRSGDRLDAVWVVRRGAVRRHQPGPDVVIEEGELIGVREILDDRPLADDHEVIEDLLAYLIPADDFRQLAANGTVRQALDRQVGADTTGLSVAARTVAGAAHRIDAGATVAEAARAMESAGVDALLVDGLEAAENAPGPRPDGGHEPGGGPEPGGSDGDRTGIVTSRDLLSRVLSRDRGPDTTVAEVASHPVRTLDPDTPLSEALVFLLDNDIHHAPLGEGSAAQLMLADADILTHFGSDSFSLLRRISTGGPDRGDEFAESVARAVIGMVRAEVGPGTIGRAVTSLVDGLMRSLCRGAEAELGPPPAPYAMCACGSQGRREQTLLTDQDNLLVHGGSDDDPWFAQLASWVIDGLTGAGIPACSGGYMATNWHGSLDWWEATVAGWVADPDPDALLDLNILADLRVVAGELPAADLWRPLHRATAEPLLIRRLGAEVIRFRPPGRLSRFLGRGAEFDVKKHGLIPIVGLGRLFGIELGLTTASTVRRLEAGAEAGFLSDDARVWLTGGLDFLTGLRLRGQLRSREATGDPGAVPLRRSDLDPVEHNTLREVLRVVSAVQHTTDDRLHLDAVG